MGFLGSLLLFLSTGSNNLSVLEEGTEVVEPWLEERLLAMGEAVQLMLSNDESSVHESFAPSSQPG
jgi:hypothetical protein